MKLLKELSNRNKIEISSASQTVSSIKEKEFCFKLVFNGRQDFKIGNREVSLFPDSFFLLIPGTDYLSRIESDRPVKTLSITITEDFLTDFLISNCGNSEMHLSDIRTGKPIMPIQSIYPLRGDMWFNLMNLAKTATQDVAADELLLNEYLYHCLINYYKLYNHEILMAMEKLTFVRSSTKTETMRRLALAKEYISSNYNKKFRLEDIAAVCFLSVNHLLRTFKQAYGLSPYQYLTFVRLNRAKILLETEHHSVNEVVMLVGFESVSSFIRLFKATFECTPLKFKKNFFTN